MRTPSQILDQEHLDIRHQLLEIAAFLDRLDANHADPSSLRSSSAPSALDANHADPSSQKSAQDQGSIDADLRLIRIRAGLELLATDQVSTDRCKRLSLLFSGTDAKVAQASTA